MTDARDVIARALHPDLATVLLRAFETAYSNALGDPFGSYLEDEEAEQAMRAVVADFPAVLAAAGLSITATPDTDDTVPKQVLRDLADEWVRPRRNVRIMEDGYASVFILGAQEYAAELRAAIGDVTDV